MKKTRANAGFTLMELLVTLVILVFLLIGIGFGMDTGNSIYREAVFEADSATLAGTINTNLGDILRYSQDLRENTGYFKDSVGNNLSPGQVSFVFTSLEYGIQDAYFYAPSVSGGRSQGILEIKNLKNANVLELVNSGTYPNLEISNFKITYVAPGENSSGGSGRGGYFNVSYIISSTSNKTMTRNVSTVIRLLND